MAARAPIFPKKQKAQPVEDPLPRVDDRVRIRAYEIYLQRGGQAGSEVDDWLQAEAELNANRNAK